MRKVIVGRIAVAVVLLALVGATTVTSQTRSDRDGMERQVRVFAGLGSAIGATVRELSKEDAAKAKLAQPVGALIQGVEDPGPAAKAGLKPGDVVVEFDGERVRSARHLSRLVEETPEGRTVKATIVRNGSRQTLDITPQASERRLADVVIPNVQREIQRELRRLPRDFDLDLDGPGIVIAPRGRLGVSVEPLTDQLADYFGAKPGVLVSSVTPGSAAAKAGLRAGDVITSINEHPVEDPQRLSTEVRRLAPGAVVQIGIVRDKRALSVEATMLERATRRAEPVRPI